MTEGNVAEGNVEIVKALQPEFIDAGENVVAFVRVRGRTRRDSVAAQHAPAAVWILRDGVVRRIEFYLDRDMALAAVGMR